jgi:hypothetical protein
MRPERIRTTHAAEILGSTPRTVQALALRGELPDAARIGGVWTFSEAALRRYKDKLPEVQEKIRKRQHIGRDTIYFALCGREVKIGYTRDLKARISALQTGNATPIEVLLAFDGPIAVEKYLHNRFDDLRIRGEWFTYGSAIRQWLRRPFLPADLFKRGSDAKV